MSSSGDALARRLKGKAHKKYKDVDYDSIQKLLDAKKRVAQSSVSKVLKIKDQSKKATEEKITHLHRGIWQVEHGRLERLRLRLENALENSLAFEQTNDDVVDNAYLEFQIKYASHVERFYDMKLAVEDKVIELQSMARAIASSLRRGNTTMTADRSPSDVLDEHHRLQRLLFAEADKLRECEAVLHDAGHSLINTNDGGAFVTSDDLESANSTPVPPQTPDDSDIDLLYHDASDATSDLEDGIRHIFPELLSCADEELKLHILSEIQELRSKFASRADALRLVDKTRGDKLCGWNHEDHHWYIKLEKEYLRPSNQKKLKELCKLAGTSCRQLMFERMLMERPKFTRADLVTHEDAVASHRYIVKQISHLRVSEKAELENLRDHANSALEMARKLQEQQLMAVEEQAAFDSIRLQMSEKIFQWKREQLSHAMKSQREEQTRLQYQQEWEEQEETRIQAERASLKKKVQQHKEEQNCIAALAKEEELRKNKEQRILQLEQAKVNEKRIEHRRALEQEKIARARAHEVYLDELARQKEQRLDALRATVKIEASIDPERTRQHTVASSTAADANIDHRLGIPGRTSGRTFVNHGYSQKDVASDRRLRVEAAIRQAGLHGTEYARAALGRVQPPSQPRPDMKSSVFQSE
eukprot:m.272231 g.272231  ORF g.272231 m.272231 type:complete len:645 (-) comp100462_c0_seq1:43-1977(-)